MSSSQAETKPVVQPLPPRPAVPPSTGSVKMMPPGPFNPGTPSVVIKPPDVASKMPGVVSKMPGVGSKPSNEPEPKMAALPPQTPVAAVPEAPKEETKPKAVQYPVNFACLYYCTFSNEPWPDTVAEWGKKSVPNQYFLNQLKQTAARNEATIRMIEALQRDLENRSG